MVSLRSALGRASALLILLAAMQLVWAPRVEAVDGEVLLLTIDGVINPLTAQYLERGVQEGARQGMAAVVVRLDTPGGLESAMRRMAQAMLNSAVPVVVYVSPPGARAASAGMFVTLAANVSAMAPGTNIGAAHPVGLGGQTDPVMMEKVLNDAAALARSIAVTRGRNAAWAEDAVRQSVAITAEEALEQNVIDLIAADLDDLLQQMDGRTAVTTAGEVTLRTAGAPVVERPMNLAERILQTIADPNIAYILFTLGTIGLIAELYNPGAFFPGIAGAISLVLAFSAFGSLPINWAGVILLALGIGLFVADLLFTEGLGILAIGGGVAFVLGSLFLYTPLRPVSPALPALRVSPWVMAVVVAGMGGFFMVVLRAVVRARRAPVATGPQALLGRAGVATSDLAPSGAVRVAGETWSAVAEGEAVRAGDTVRVVGVEGVTLRVKKA